MPWAEPSLFVNLTKREVIDSFPVNFINAGDPAVHLSASAAENANASSVSSNLEVPVDLSTVLRLTV